MAYKPNIFIYVRLPRPREIVGHVESLGVAVDIKNSYNSQRHSNVFQ